MSPKKELQVWATNVDGVLQRLRSGEWRVPQFQREFVWSVSDVVDLVLSILASRPIGMATIWEQSESSELPLRPATLPDSPQEAVFTETSGLVTNSWAILDGRQRATAIAMAFGGFRQSDGRRRFSGRYYLNLKETDSYRRVAYKSKRDLEREKLDTVAACISQGLIPLAPTEGEEDVGLMGRWLKYVEYLSNPDYYANGELPESKELERRRSVLNEAFEGILTTKLAIYAVPDTYDLAQICEIFETLNTSGTKVSTVDLIHSWLFADTEQDAEGPILLRERIDELGELDGAAGWASAKASDRPELTVQVCTATYVALNSKDEARRIGTRRLNLTVTSVKASDLLATPTAHWKNFLQHSEHVAAFWGDFQDLVGGGRFGYKQCPYPVSSAIYVALRYKSSFESEDTKAWQLPDLDALYKAFFWRNALAGRYDQGFLTQLGTDMKRLLELLDKRGSLASATHWTKLANEELSSMITRVPSEEELVDKLTNGRPGGALEKALTLRMLARSRTDVLDPQQAIGFGAEDTSELHHIFPKAWCRTNQTGKLADLLDEKKADRDWVNSIANRMPLGRRSNKEWKAKVPGQALAERGVAFDALEDTLGRLYIDERAFELLISDRELPSEFWLHRARLIAKDLVRQTSVSF